MPTHVALLRGINVGGRNKIAMADLRELAISLGHTEVATYIASGNVVFTSRETDTAKLGAALERAISASLAAAPSVVVLSRSELAQVIAENPYPEEINPKLLHAQFHPRDLTPEEVAAVAAAVQRARAKGSDDEARLIGRTLFLRTPGGLGRSELAVQLNKKSALGGARGTARNWATVNKLMALLGTPVVRPAQVAAKADVET